MVTAPSMKPARGYFAKMHYELPWLRPGADPFDALLVAALMKLAKGGHSLTDTRQKILDEFGHSMRQYLASMKRLREWGAIAERREGTAWSGRRIYLLWVEPGTDKPSYQSTDSCASARSVCARSARAVCARPDRQMKLAYKEEREREPAELNSERKTETVSLRPGSIPTREAIADPELTGRDDFATLPQTEEQTASPPDNSAKVDRLQKDLATMREDLASRKIREPAKIKRAEALIRIGELEIAELLNPPPVRMPPAPPPRVVSPGLPPARLGSLPDARAPARDESIPLTAVFAALAAAKLKGPVAAREFARLLGGRHGDVKPKTMANFMQTAIGLRADWIEENIREIERSPGVMLPTHVMSKRFAKALAEKGTR